MQKITPFLWFDTQAEEAAKFYTSLFDNSKIGGVRRYGDAGPGPRGQVMTLSFQLDGMTFMALNGGPQFTFTPAVSFFVTCRTEQEIDALWKKLSKGGKVLMELQKYPFSEKFGWTGDKYGLTWQLHLTGGPARITPFFLFVGKQHGKAEEAMKYWGSIFPSSAIHQVQRYGEGQGEEAGTVMHGRFSLAGQEFMAMDSNREHAFSFNEAISFSVDCETQEEVDELWGKLSAGGKESRCGWLQDKYGVSWQIVPSVLGELLGDKSPARAQKVMQAMLKMSKLDIKELQAAAR
ncbi:MAG TPA: VOC family protein [Spirochaetia bacterium]|nr:VOC family protein [Spirochaetia bacterium]